MQTVLSFLAAFLVLTASAFADETSDAVKGALEKPQTSVGLGDLHPVITLTELAAAFEEREKHFEAESLPKRGSALQEKTLELEQPNSIERAVNWLFSWRDRSPSQVLAMLVPSVLIVWGLLSIAFARTFAHLPALRIPLDLDVYVRKHRSRLVSIHINQLRRYAEDQLKEVQLVPLPILINHTVTLTADKWIEEFLGQIKSPGHYRAAMVGRGGTGKTVLINKLVLSLIRDRYVPLLLRGNDYEGESSFDALITRIMDRELVPVSARLWRRLPNLVYVIDQCSEVRSEYQHGFWRLIQSQFSPGGAEIKMMVAGRLIGDPSTDMGRDLQWEETIKPDELQDEDIKSLGRAYLDTTRTPREIPDFPEEIRGITNRPTALVVSLYVKARQKSSRSIESQWELFEKILADDVKKAAIPPNEKIVKTILGKLVEKNFLLKGDRGLPGREPTLISQVGDVFDDLRVKRDYEHRAVPAPDNFVARLLASGLVYPTRTRHLFFHDSFEDWLAMDYYETSVAIGEEFKDRKTEGQFLGTLGDVFSDWSEYDKAVECYEKSLEIKIELNDRKGEGATLSNLGDIFYGFGEYDNARDYYEEALATYRELKDPWCEARTLNRLGGVFNNRDHYENAAKYHEKALVIYQDLKDQRGEARTLHHLGGVFNNRDQYENAAKYHERALAIFREIKDRKWEGTTLQDLGDVLRKWGEYDKAVESYEEALRVYRELKDFWGEADTLHDLGDVFWKLRQYDKAVQSCQMSVALRMYLKDRSGEARTLHFLGDIFWDWGQGDKARDNYEEALVIFREIEDRKWQGIALNDLGDIFSEWDQYDKARHNYEEALVIFREIEDREWQGIALNDLGAVFRKWGEYDKAVEYHAEALVIFREIENRWYVARTLNNLGAVFRNRDQYDNARDYYEEALAIFREIENRKWQGITLNDLGAVFRKCGQYDKAVDCHEEALATYREIEDRWVTWREP